VTEAIKHPEASSPIAQELERLRRASNVVRAMFDATDNGLAIIGPDFMLIETNGRMDSWFERRATGSPQPCHGCLYRRTDDPCPSCPGIACLQSGVPRTAMIDVPDPSGLRRFEVSCIPLKAVDGTVLGILESARDLTAKPVHTMQVELNEADPMLFIENAGDAILTFNEQGIITQINRAACEISGYGAKELLGMPASVLVPAEVRSRLYNARLGMLHAAGLPPKKVIEGCLMRKDGTTVPVEETIAVQHHAGGTMITSIIRDISTHKSREENLRNETTELARQVAYNARLLRRTEERYRALVDSAKDAILTADSSSAILSCNRRAAELYGLKPDELTGRAITEIMPARVWDEARAALQAPGASGNRMIESKMTGPGGMHVPMEITISVFESDKHRQVAFIMRDISRHKNLEQRLQEYSATLEEKVRERTAELQENRDRLVRSEKLAAVGQMSATVAHGIRNPLVSIGGFARRLLKKETEHSDARKYLQIIIDEIDRIETVLSELLDFVRPRSLVLKTLSINALLEKTLASQRAEFAQKNILLEQDPGTGLPDIEIDAGQLSLVLNHVFDNATDAMPQGGTLRVCTALDGSMIKITIADSGIGIAPEDSEKIFHPFFTRKPSGSGLGLAICNQIIAIHGGHIRLRRQLPQGTAFEIYLPLKTHDAPPPC